MALSKTQIDKLGERLKNAQPTENDLSELDEYRRSFLPQHQQIVTAIEQRLGLQPTGRTPKTVLSIVAKLRRESIRLSQIQDIAGCRVVAAGLDAQNRIVHDVQNLFENVSVVDRRQHLLELLRNLSDYLMLVEESDISIPIMEERISLMAFGPRRAEFEHRVAGLKREHEELIRSVGRSLSELRSFVEKIGRQ